MTERPAAYAARRSQLKDGSISEKAFSAQVKKYAELHGWKAYHTWNSIHSPSGFPDLCFARPKEQITPIYPAGDRLIFAELKSASGKVTQEQDNWIAAISLAGVPCYVWRPSDWPEIERVLGGDA